MIKTDEAIQSGPASGGSCGYEGAHFGATYPDAVCIDGYLWDLDSCDEPGGPLFSGGDVPCPCCKTREYVEAGDHAIGGNAKQRRCRRRAMVRKVQTWAVSNPGYWAQGGAA